MQESATPRRRDHEAVATATAGAFRDLPPAVGRGSESDGNPLGRLPLADQKKCTESVSSSSSSPDRPPPKRLPGGSAFNLRRSVLGALGNLVAHFASVKRESSKIVANTDKCVSVCFFPPKLGSIIAQTQKCTEAGAPSSGFPTDLRRSDCLSESHQPPALRPRCNWDTTTRATRRQDRSGAHCPLFATFSLHIGNTCVEHCVLYINGTKDSPSRVRFRPLPRLTFRFRVRPSGRASSYSRPVLGAAAIYAPPTAPARGSVDGKAANCVGVEDPSPGSTLS
jgi:hypothetical protein